jgi:hypothetical protein
MTQFSEKASGALRSVRLIKEERFIKLNKLFHLQQTQAARVAQSVERVALRHRLPQGRGFEPRLGLNSRLSISDGLFSFLAFLLLLFWSFCLLRFLSGTGFKGTCHPRDTDKLQDRPVSSIPTFSALP